VSRALVIAHRGASGYEVENSLAAFRAAARLRADAVELDVHAAADGTLVVHHDETIGGTHHIPTSARDSSRGSALRTASRFRPWHRRSTPRAARSRSSWR